MNNLKTKIDSFCVHLLLARAPELPKCHHCSCVHAGANKKVIDKNPLTEVQKIFEIYTQDTLQYECRLIMMPLVLSERGALYLFTIVSTVC